MAMSIENWTYYGMAMSVRFSVHHTLDNDSFHSFAQDIDGLMDSNDVWYTDVS
jgi:hypothetical protein